MSGLTLRQIEVIRAVMLTGSIRAAAEFLNVSAPGISRLVKHAEESLSIRLFDRRGGVFLPASEAQSVFDQINEVYGKIAGLETAIENLNSGRSGALALGSAPSVAQFILARATIAIRARFPELYVDLNVLKIEETVDYLLLERGEFVAMSHRYAHPSLISRELAQGQLVAVVPDGHRLAALPEVSVHALVKEPLVGVSPDDPYGAIIASPFQREGLDYKLSIRGRFAQTVVSLVRHGLGVAVIDEFSVAGVYMPGLTRIPLTEITPIGIYVHIKRGHSLSAYAQFAEAQLRAELRKAIKSRPWMDKSTSN